TPMPGSASRRIAAPVLALAALAAICSTEAAPSKSPNLGLGYEYDLGGGREEFLLPDPLQDPSIAPDHPLYVRLPAPWSMLEPSPGSYDWSGVARILAPYRAANFVVALCLYGPNPSVDPAGRPPTSAQGEVLRAWLAFVRATALHFKGQIEYYEVW